MKSKTMMCGSACGSSCGCGSDCGGRCGRNFLTKDERIEKLNKYKEWLDNESKGVHETIEDLKKAS